MLIEQELRRLSLNLIHLMDDDLKRLYSSFLMSDFYDDEIYIVNFSLPQLSLFHFFVLPTPYISIHVYRAVYRARMLGLLHRAQIFSEIMSIGLS